MSSPEYRFTTAMDMFLEHGASLGLGHHDASEMRMQSGMPFGIHVIRGDEHEGRTLAAVVGDMDMLASLTDGPLVRMHSACRFSELGDDPEIDQLLAEPPTDRYTISATIIKRANPSLECDCHSQRIAAQTRIAEEGGIYFDLIEQEGRGAGLDVKREAYRLHREEGLDTVEAYERLGVPFDTRQYDHCAKFLLEHGIEQVQLMSNNPRKQNALRAAGITVIPVPLVVGVTDKNIDYLETKRDKAGHQFPTELHISEQS